MASPPYDRPSTNIPPPQNPANTRTHPRMNMVSRGARPPVTRSREAHGRSDRPFPGSVRRSGPTFRIDPMFRHNPQTCGKSLTPLKRKRPFDWIEDKTIATERKNTQNRKQLLTSASNPVETRQNPGEKTHYLRRKLCFDNTAAEKKSSSVRIRSCLRDSPGSPAVAGVLLTRLLTTAPSNCRSRMSLRLLLANNKLAARNEHFRYFAGILLRELQERKIVACR
jgi:hypothetical protein